MLKIAVLGIDGRYKSSFLAQYARLIELYNKPQIKRRCQSLTPTVLITTENSTEETVTRLFNMVSGD